MTYFYKCNKLLLVKENIMNNQCKVTLVKAGAIISLIEGILLCISIIGLVFGIFNIIAYCKFKEIYIRSVDEAAQDINNSKYFGWSIYVLIVTFPLGLLSFLPYILQDSNTNNSSSINNNQ